MNILFWGLIAVVVFLLVIAFLRRRSHSPLECPRCNSTNSYRSYGDHYALCQECAREVHVERIAAKKNPHN